MIFHNKKRWMHNIFSDISSLELFMHQLEGPLVSTGIVSLQNFSIGGVNRETFRMKAQGGATTLHSSWAEICMCVNKGCLEKAWECLRKCCIKMCSRRLKSYFFHTSRNLTALLIRSKCLQPSMSLTIPIRAGGFTAGNTALSSLDYHPVSKLEITSAKVLLEGQRGEICCKQTATMWEGL